MVVQSSEGTADNSYLGGSSFVPGARACIEISQSVRSNVTSVLAPKLVAKLLNPRLCVLASSWTSSACLTPLDYMKQYGFLPQHLLDETWCGKEEGGRQVFYETDCCAGPWYREPLICFVVLLNLRLPSHHPSHLSRILYGRIYNPSPSPPRMAPVTMAPGLDGDEPSLCRASTNPSLPADHSNQHTAYITLSDASNSDTIPTTWFSPDIAILIDDIRAERTKLDDQATFLVDSMHSMWVAVDQVEKTPTRPKVQITRREDNLRPGRSPLAASRYEIALKMRVIATLVVIVATAGSSRHRGIETKCWKSRLAKLPPGTVTRILELLLSAITSLDPV